MTLKTLIKQLFCCHRRKELLSINGSKVASHAAKIGTFECKNCGKIVREVI